MSDNLQTIGAGEFKARCLQLMTQLQNNRTPIVITKRGTPIAKLVPYDDKAPPLFGCLKGTIAIEGDIVAPIDEPWDADND